MTHKSPKTQALFLLTAFILMSVLFSPHAFAAHPRIKPAHLQKIAQAFISLNQDDAGVKLLSAINFKGIQTATDTDWDDVRALKIEPLK